MNPMCRHRLALSSCRPRSFALPANVDATAAEARRKNGVPKVTLPKEQGGAATRIAIQ